MALDAGCGFGDRIHALRKTGYTNIYGIDTDPHCVDTATEKNIRLGSITATKFQPFYFDCVLVEGVFHHLSEYDLTLKEISRILKPGGNLCIIEP